MEQEDLPRPKHVHVLGESLEAISLDELHLRIAALQMEIARIQAEIARKKASKSMADAFFKS